MYLMLGCGTTTPAFDVVLPCAGIPGYSVIVWSGTELGLWPSELPTPSGGVPGCFVDYWPGYG